MKYLQINLTKPCSEGWDTMKPDEKGRFCATCAKTVVDFTGMSDADMLSFFKKNKGKAVCGRFNPYQLDNPLPIHSSSPLRYAQAFALAAGIALTSATQAEPPQLPHLEIVSEQKLPDSPKVQTEVNLDTTHKIVFNLIAPDEKCTIEMSAFGLKKQAINGQFVFDLPNARIKKTTIKLKITFSDPRIKTVNQEIHVTLNDKNVFAIKIEGIPMQGGVETEVIQEGDKKVVRTKQYVPVLSFRAIIYPTI
jgi:hypothetical protein